MRRVIATVSAAALAASALAFVGATAQADVPEPKANDCLQVPKDRVSDELAEFTIVPCDESHTSDVYKVIDYPADEGAPSTIKDRTYELFGEFCSYDDFQRWLGSSKFKMPVRVYRVFRLPTDEQWEAGARWVACSAYRPGKNFTGLSYKGTMPAALKSSAPIEWASCLNKTPTSGKWNFGSTCTSKSKWVLINGIQVKGKIGPTYPKDLQAKADAMCAKKAKGLLKKGAKSKAVAGLGPKSDFPDGDPFAECFIMLSDWTGEFR